MSGRVAVVGGGLAGLTCASQLAKAGLGPVDVFDMGARGPGGRASSKVYPHGQLRLGFDYGLQIFPCRSPDSAALFRDWERAGALQVWDGKIGIINAPHHSTEAPAKAGPRHDVLQSTGFCGCEAGAKPYVGTPSSDAVCQLLAKTSGVNLAKSAKVTKAERAADGTWKLGLRSGGPEGDASAEAGGYEGLVLADAMTVQQGSPGFVDLGSAAASPLAQRLRQVTKRPVFSLLAAFSAATPLRLPFDAVSVSGSPTLQWLCEDTAKPGRARSDGVTCWVAVSSEGFAASVLARSAEDIASPPSTAFKDQVAGRLWGEVKAAISPCMQQGGRAPIPEPLFMTTQRWGSGFKGNIVDTDCLVDPEQMLLACGDFCGGPSTDVAERAILSGLAAARVLVRLL